MLDGLRPSPAHSDHHGCREAPAPVCLPQPPTDGRPIGHGASFASFGEIVQGRRADGEDFLVTLPVDLWSRCRAVCEPAAGPSRVAAPLPKSRQAAERLLHLLGLGTGVRLHLRLDRDMPVGKGLSSSTADMLAVVRACEALFGTSVGTAAISRLFAAVEPHDALHYADCVAYNHRRGRLLARLGHVPDFRIIAVDAGGAVCSQTYNRRLDFSPALVAAHQRLYERVTAAFAARDDAAIARCARRSAELHIARTGNAFLRRLLRQAARMDVLGVVTTHSGTCGGLLLPGDADTAYIERASARVRHLGRVFTTTTLKPRP
jgi:L-threonine kinase